MSPMYCGVGGVVREIKEFYCGQNGVARKISEMWAGIDGVKRKIFNSVPPSLNDCTWEEISDISTAGEGANYWAIGDRKQVTLKGKLSKLSLSNYSTYAFIIGFNHNSSREGSGRIHFQIGKTALTGGTDICLISGYSDNSDFYMNTSDTNSGGWKDSYMRNNICGTSKTSYTGTIIGVIPAALRAVLKSVTKYTNNNGESSSSRAVTATTDYFFLLSEYEVFGNIKYSNSYEANYQQQYAYYSAGNSKVKYRHDQTGSLVGWWLRSPRADGSSRFVCVTGDGFANTSYSSNDSRGFAPGFCV